MCEYCNKIINNKKILDIDNEIKTHMEIINQTKSWRYMLYNEQVKIIRLDMKNRHVRFITYKEALNRVERILIEEVRRC